MVFYLRGTLKNFLPYLGGGANNHAIVVADDTVKLLHGKLVLHVGVVTPLLEYVHANLLSSTSVRQDRTALAVNPRYAMCIDIDIDMDIDIDIDIV